MSLPLWPLTHTSSFPSSACPFQFFLPSSYQPTLFRHPNLSPLLATMFIIPTPFFPFSSLNLSPLLATMFHTYPLLPILFPKCFTLGWQLLRHLRRLRWPVTCTFCKFLPFLSPLLNLSQKHNQICHLRLQVSVVATHRPVRLYALLLSYFVTLLLLPKCFHLALTTKLVAGVWGVAGGHRERLLPSYHLNLVRQLSFGNSLVFLFPGSSLIRFTFSPVLGGVRRLISSAPSC